MRMLSTTSDSTPTLLCLQAAEADLSSSRRVFLERMPQVASTALIIVSDPCRGFSISCIGIFISANWWRRGTTLVANYPPLVYSLGACLDPYQDKSHKFILSYGLFQATRSNGNNICSQLLQLLLELIP